MVVIAAVDNKGQSLAFGGRCCQLWQWRWQPLTAAIAVVVDVNDRTTGGLTNLDNGQAWWWQHQQQQRRWRQQQAVGHHPVVVVDGGGKDVIAAAAIDHRCSRQ